MCQLRLQTHILSVQARSGQMDFWCLAKDAILPKDEKVGPWIRECNLQISCNFEIMCMFGHDVDTNTQSEVQCNFVIGRAYIDIGAKELVSG